MVRNSKQKQKQNELIIVQLQDKNRIYLSSWMGSSKGIVSSSDTLHPGSMQINSFGIVQQFPWKSYIMKFFPFHFVPLKEFDYLTFLPHT